MPYLVEALLAVHVLWLLVNVWENYKRHKFMERALELLAARSYGEFAAGKSKLEGKTKPSAEFDPGF